MDTPRGDAARLTTLELCIRSMLGRIAIWDCDAIASLNVTTLHGNWVKTRAPKYSHSEIEHENDPVAITSLQNDEWGRALEVFSSSTAFSSLLTLVL